VELSDGYIAYPNATLAFGEMHQVAKYFGDASATAHFAYFEGDGERKDVIHVPEKSSVFMNNVVGLYESLAESVRLHVPNLSAPTVHALLVNMFTHRAISPQIHSHVAVERFDNRIEFCYNYCDIDALPDGALIHEPNSDIETILEVMFDKGAQTYNFMKTVGFSRELSKAHAALRAAGLPPIAIDDHEWAQGMYWRRVIIYLNN
jgi:hypothetical protein